MRALNRTRRDEVRETGEELPPPGGVSPWRYPRRRPAASPARGGEPARGAAPPMLRVACASLRCCRRNVHLSRPAHFLTFLAAQCDFMSSSISFFFFFFRTHATSFFLYFSSFIHSFETIVPKGRIFSYYVETIVVSDGIFFLFCWNKAEYFFIMLKQLL